MNMEADAAPVEVISQTNHEAGILKLYEASRPDDVNLFLSQHQPLYGKLLRMLNSHRIKLSLLIQKLTYIHNLPKRRKVAKPVLPIRIRAYKLVIRSHICTVTQKINRILLQTDMLTVLAHQTLGGYEPPLALSVDSLTYSEDRLTASKPVFNNSLVLNPSDD